MSTSMNNLFNYSRSLPEPFKALSSKKVKTTSVYGNGTEATLCATVIKAVNAVCACMNGTGQGAVGIIDHRSVAEYKSSNSPEEYHLVVYDSASGNLMASVYDDNTEVLSNYIMTSSARDGAAVMMAVIPKLLEDSEFEENFSAYYDQFVNGFADMTVTTDAMAILCDNAYRRIKDETCKAHVKVEVDRSGNVMRVSQAQIDSGNFTPTTVTAGEFHIFAKSGPAVIKKASTFINHSDFVGQYTLSSRTLSEDEKQLVPKLQPWYIIPEEVVDICKHAQITTGKPMQMRNFLLRGPAGTGKTMGAKAIAAGL